MVLPKLYKGQNKTFFFGDYQGTRIHQGLTKVFTVPTANMRAGNFRASLSRLPQHRFDPRSDMPTWANPLDLLVRGGSRPAIITPVIRADKSQFDCSVVRAISG